jgi:predicted GIY-YIG superfamily endonuclease
MPKRNWSVYLARCSDGSLYTGLSTDVPARIAKHNSGKGAKYTRSRRPVVLVYEERLKSATSARQREAEIKSWPRSKKLALLKK